MHLCSNMAVPTDVVMSSLQNNSNSTTNNSVCVSITQSCPTLCHHMDPSITPQALLSMGLPRQEYWSGLPFPSPVVEPRSPALWADSLPSEPQGKSSTNDSCYLLNY